MRYSYFDEEIDFSLSRYYEAVFPGDYGIPNPPWFFVTKSYWCGSSSGKVDDSHEPTVSQTCRYKHSAMQHTVFSSSGQNYFHSGYVKPSSQKPWLWRGAHGPGSRCFHLQFKQSFQSMSTKSVFCELEYLANSLWLGFPGIEAGASRSYGERIQETKGIMSS